MQALTQKQFSILRLALAFGVLVALSLFSYAKKTIISDSQIKTELVKADACQDNGASIEKAQNPNKDLFVTCGGFI